MRANISPNRVLSADFLDGFIFRFIQEVYLREGETASGLQNYYAYRLRNHVGGIQDYEGAVFRYLMETVPHTRCIVHVGSGIGTTTVLFAASGRRIIGIERGQPRFKLATQLRTAMISVWPDVEQLYQLSPSPYPDALHDLPEAQGPDCLLLFTNFAAGHPAGFPDAVIATFVRFGNVVLDLRTFCDTLEDETQRRDLHDRILAVGMKDVGPIRTNSGNFYHHFTR